MLSIQTFFFREKEKETFENVHESAPPLMRSGWHTSFSISHEYGTFFFSYTPTLLALATHVAFRQIGKAYFSLEFQETSTRSERRSMGPHPPDSRETPFLAWKRQKRSRPLKRSDIAARLLNKNKKERKKERKLQTLSNQWRHSRINIWPQQWNGSYFPISSIIVDVVKRPSPMC